MRFLLPNMEQMYPLAYLQHMSVRRTMDWKLVKPISRVSLGKIGAREAFTVGHGRDVLGLQPGLVRAKYPTGKTPQLVATFIRKFLDVRGDFPLEFCAIRWIHSTNKTWWGRMVGFALTEFEDLLLQAGLYGAVRLSSTAFRRALNISTPSWSGIIQRSARSSLPSRKWGLPSMRCTKSQSW